jgi:hypothetical protein
VSTLLTESGRKPSQTMIMVRVGDKAAVPESELQPEINAVATRAVVNRVKIFILFESSNLDINFSWIENLGDGGIENNQ